MGVVALLYGVIAYVLFFASFLYLVAFIGGGMIPFIEVPKTIDAGTSPFAGGAAAFVNIGLLLLFGVQHTVMARPGFKKVWTRIVPKSIERSTYVLITAALLYLIYLWWVPMPAVVWSVSGLWASVLTGLFFVGILVVLLSTFLINHFDLFGLQQVWHRFQQKDMPTPKFVTPFLYKWVRHPLYLGFIIAFWATPLMTVGHLLFAAIWTAYIFVAMGYEERDLIGVHGEDYRAYADKVPMIFPLGKRK
jgi:protein-S-isoprenylcysteine O-methyltransferase Ste14